jgi:hypothetical protein
MQNYSNILDLAFFISLLIAIIIIAKHMNITLDYSLLLIIIN